MNQRQGGIEDAIKQSAQCKNVRGELVERQLVGTRQLQSPGEHDISVISLELPDGCFIAGTTSLVFTRNLLFLLIGICSSY